jgi:hypothetical protein
MSNRSPAEVSFYLGLATAIATFSAAAVALGLLHCTRWRDRAVSVGVLLCGTLGVGAALATVARGRATGVANIVIGGGVLVVAAYVLLRALRLIFAVYQKSHPPASPPQNFSTRNLPVIWTWPRASRDASASAPSRPNAPAVLGAPTAPRVFRGPLWATASAFTAIIALTTVLAVPELFDSILRSRPVGVAHAACSDGLDNDRDGRTDYPQDPGCSSRTDRAERQAVACSDGADNDADGRTDYPQDPDCSSRADIAEGQAVACSDGVDNDGDGLTDYRQDPGCASPTDRAEREAACSDGLDNDRDGRTDFPQDPDCSSRADVAEK